MRAGQHRARTRRDRSAAGQDGTRFVGIVPDGIVRVRFTPAGGQPVDAVVNQNFYELRYDGVASSRAEPPKGWNGSVGHDGKIEGAPMPARGRLEWLDASGKVVGPELARSAAHRQLHRSIPRRTTAERSLRRDRIEVDGLAAQVAHDDDCRRVSRDGQELVPERDGQAEARAGALDPPGAGIPATQPSVGIAMVLNASTARGLGVWRASKASPGAAMSVSVAQASMRRR